MNKVIVITGASRGIGRNIAYNLAIDGYTVIANYNKSEEEIMKLKNELMGKNINIDIYKADVSKSREARNLINYAIERYNKIDVLINNAGIAEEKLFTDVTDDDFDIMLKNNLYSVFYLTQEAVRFMLKEKSGLIAVLIATIILLIPFIVMIIPSDKSSIILNICLKKDVKDRCQTKDIFCLLYP